MKVNVNSISGVNETRFLVQHESCKCKFGLNESVWNSKQKWNHNDFWCKCKQLDYWRPWKADICGILAHVIASVIKHVKLMSIQI